MIDHDDRWSVQNTVKISKWNRKWTMNTVIAPKWVTAAVWVHSHFVPSSPSSDCRSALAVGAPVICKRGHRGNGASDKKCGDTDYIQFWSIRVSYIFDDDIYKSADWFYSFCSLQFWPLRVLWPLPFQPLNGDIDAIPDHNAMRKMDGDTIHSQTAETFVVRINHKRSELRRGQTPWYQLRTWWSFKVCKWIWLDLSPVFRIDDNIMCIPYPTERVLVERSSCFYSHIPIVRFVFMAKEEEATKRTIISKPSSTMEISLILCLDRDKWKQSIDHWQWLEPLKKTKIQNVL